MLDVENFILCWLLVFVVGGNGVGAALSNEIFSSRWYFLGNLLSVVDSREVGVSGVMGKGVFWQAHILTLVSPYFIGF